MSGIAGVIANDSARYSLFWSCMDHLHLPDGWRKEHLIGGDWCGARNSLCELTLESGAEWLWFMDDDHAFSPDLLTKLLSHNLPLVVPVCLTRSAPFEPVTFTENLDDSDRPIRRRLSLPEQSSDGLVELTSGGSAGMLIHRTVLQTVKRPWFEYGFVSEDLMFCDKAKAEGFDIYCDLDARLGHLTTAIVEPVVHEGEWGVGVRIGSVGATTSVVLPIEASSLSEKVLV